MLKIKLFNEVINLLILLKKRLTRYSHCTTPEIVSREEICIMYNKRNKIELGLPVFSSK
jgi:hypothetical protein